MEQINSAFVSTKKISIEDDDGQPKDITVLVLDDKANTEYWNTYNSFSKVIQDAKIHGPNEALVWLMSESFIKDNIPVLDLLDSVFIKEGEEVMGIHGIPIAIEQSDVKFCRLKLKNDTVIPLV